MSWDADAHFEVMLDEYQQRLEDEAWQAEQRSYEAAARPEARPLEATFADLRVGDFMTNEGPRGRWVEVIDLRGPCCYVGSRQQAVADGEVSVLFRLVESVVVSGETDYWIERPPEEPVTIDGRAR